MEVLGGQRQPSREQHSIPEVANLILVFGGDTTAHEVRQRARCHNCGVKGNNTYQIVYTGNSDFMAYQNNYSIFFPTQIVR